jgi:hypothetical protein
MNNEMERMQKEAVMTKFKVLSQQMYARTEENHNKNLSQDNWSPGQDLKLGPRKHKLGELSTQLQHSVCTLCKEMHNPLLCSELLCAHMCRSGQIKSKCSNNKLNLF